MSDDVRIAALKLLRDAGINLPEDLRHELPLWDDAEAVRAEAYKYLVSLGDEGALSLVENNITAESADDSAPREARLSILQRLRPKEAFTEMIESGQYVSDGAISKLALHFADFEDQILLKGVENQWEEVRKFSISELAKRGRLPPGLAEKLTHDPSMKIRQLAFIELAR